MTCKNCNSELSGKFCSACGQKSRTGRISSSYLVNEIPESILQLNRGFFYTIKELLIRPGHSIRNFLSGERVSHYKPLAFLLVTTSIYILAHYFLESNTMFYEAFEGMIAGAIEDGEDSKKYTNWVSKYQVYIPFLILLPYTASTYLAFYKFKYNYFEHLVINLYITGQQMLIYWILGYFFLEENYYTAVPIFIGMIYNFWAFIQIFNNTKTWIKISLVFLSYIIFIVGTLGIIFAIINISILLH